MLPAIYVLILLLTLFSAIVWFSTIDEDGDIHPATAIAAIASIPITVILAILALIQIWKG